MSDFLVAIGLLFVIEGTLHAVFPGTIKWVARVVSETGEPSLRIGGLITLATGVFLVWLVRYAGAS